MNVKRLVILSVMAASLAGTALHAQNAPTDKNTQGDIATTRPNDNKNKIRITKALVAGENIQSLVAKKMFISMTDENSKVRAMSKIEEDGRATLRNLETGVYKATITDGIDVIYSNPTVIVDGKSTLNLTLGNAKYSGKIESVKTVGSHSYRIHLEEATVRKPSQDLLRYNTTSDADGKFSFENLKAGYYTMFIEGSDSTKPKLIEHVKVGSPQDYSNDPHIVIESAE